MRLDGVAGVVEHWPGRQVGLGHPKGPLDLPEVVVLRDHFRGGRHGAVEVGHVALQSDQGLRASQGSFVENAVTGMDLDESGDFGLYGHRR
jgi:hypothetical protein